MKRFNNPKYQKLLIRMIGNKYKIEELAKVANVNTGHLRNVIDAWCLEGILKRDRKGRDYIITLTDKGTKIAEKCQELWQIIENYEPAEPAIKIPEIEEKKETEQGEKENDAE